MYIDNEIDSVELNDQWLCLSKLKQICVVLCFGKSKILVGWIYRPDDFRDMVEIGKVISSARKYVDKRDFQGLIIMGDFNFPS